jgi:hypothetical protein
VVVVLTNETNLIGERVWLNRMCPNIFNPIASQNVMYRKPKIDGTIQFHKYIKGAPIIINEVKPINNIPITKFILS